MTQVTVHHGDALDVLATLPDCSADSVVTDPPYALGFMGQAWDTHTPGGFQHWCEMWARECLRVLKPGGHLAAFGGTRTYHRLVAGIEDAGFEVRDSLHWLYASGFPKSLDVSKAIDKAAGATPIVLGPDEYRRARANRGTTSEIQPSYDKPRAAQAEAMLTAPATDAARTWQGWGTALKPAHEPIVLARKPLAGTVAGNVQAWGTGALNIDGCRVAYQSDSDRSSATPRGKTTSLVGGLAGRTQRPDGERTGYEHVQGSGRWPANVVLSHVPLLDESGEPVGDACADGCVPGCQVAALDTQSGHSSGKRSVRVRPGGIIGNGRTHGAFVASQENVGGYDDSGGASRFFPTFRYQAKAPARERPNVDGVRHPTVKPLALMAWLVRLVTPPGGTVLDPFAGSGTTAEACIAEGFACVAIEREADYLPLIHERIRRQQATPAPVEDPQLTLETA